MKAGFHVDETLDEIIFRKQKEERACGKVFWGYSGTLCHPTKQIIPFVKKTLDRGTQPVLVLTSTPSKLVKPRRVAKEYSTDGKKWITLPKGVLVAGSKYAIICRKLKVFSKEIDLSKFEVAAGPNSGKPLMEYLRHRIDKACAFLSKKSVCKSAILKVNYIAKITEPYAVFLR